MFRDLARLPGSPHLHRWADWAEALCIYEGMLTAPDLSTEVEKRADSLHVEAEDDVEPGLGGVESLKTPFKSDAEFSDAVTQRASDTFALLAARAAEYGDQYPFELDDAGRRLTLRNLQPNRGLYLFLLTCSTFRYLDDAATQTDLAGRFEWLSLQALRAQLPARAEVHLFGANPQPGARYDVGLRDRVRRLGGDIREELLIDVDREFPSDSGDNGLDLVGWLDQPDASPGLAISFGQCACTPQWVSKQHSSSHAAWNPAFRFTVPPANFCFIPFDFRGTDGDWYLRTSIQGSVVIDRRRLLKTVGLADSHGELIALDDDVRTQLNLEGFMNLLQHFDWPAALVSGD